MSDSLADVLNKAAVRGDSDTIRTCHDRGNGVNVSDALGCTPLITASMFGRTTVVETLLECGAKTEARDVWGNTALLRAAQEGRSDTVAMLLRKGANPGVKDRSDKRTALIYASMRGHREVVIQLLQYGCCVEDTDVQGWDAYAYAKKNKHRRIADILKSHKTVQPMNGEFVDISDFTLSDARTPVQNTEEMNRSETRNLDVNSKISLTQKEVENRGIDFGEELNLLRTRVGSLEEKVTVLTENMEEQNVLLRTAVRDHSSWTTSRSCSAEGELLSDYVLYQLADDIGNEWMPLGNLLGFSRKKLEQFQVNHPNSIQNVILVMLQRWRDAQKKEDDEKKKILSDAFEKVHRFDLVCLLGQLTRTQEVEDEPSMQQ